ncbi:MAG TPA: NAD-dependent epimerase/dehydratase family protein [Azospirillaceae bacterium]|nr:NAD-dependent epimerase/dehydratase family protein [Azospirillaceae bacterium]
MELRGARALVTGGAGFVGSHIVDLLVGVGCADIVVVDNLIRGREANLAHAMASGKVKLVQGDIRDRRLTNDLVRGRDIVFHQAALRITHCAAEPRLALEVMVDATFELLLRCVEHRVGKVVMASSASIYGLAEEFPTIERHHPYNDRTLYGAAKAFGEGMARAFHDTYGLDYAALRYFNVYGPRMDVHGKYTEVLIRWMERIAAGQPPVIFGDGAQTMDFVHVRDVARANLLAAWANLSGFDPDRRVFNIASGTETSLLQLAHATAKAMERPDLMPVHQEERKVNPVSRRLAGTALARDVLGFESAVGLDEGLVNLIQWWRGEQTRLAPQTKVNAA